MSSNDHTNCCSKFSASQISGGDLIKRNSTNHLSGQAIWKRLHESQTCINFPGTLDQAKRQASAEGKHVLVSIDDKEVTSSSPWHDPHLVDIITKYFVFWQRGQGHAPEFEKNYVTKTPFIGIVKSESGKLLTTAADSSSEAVLQCLENQLLTEGREYTTPYSKRRRVASTDVDDLSICISNSLERFLHVSTPLMKSGGQKRSLEEDVTSSPPHKRALLPFKKRFSDSFAKDLTIQDQTPIIQDQAPSIQDQAPSIQDQAPSIQDKTPNIQDCVPDIQKDCLLHSTPGFTNQCLPDVIKIPSNSTFCLSIRHIGGERHKMLVSAHDRISRFNHLLHSLGYDCEKYQLVGHFPTRILSAMDPMCTLQSAGLNRDEVLFICEKDDE